MKMHHLVAAVLIPMNAQVVAQEQPAGSTPTRQTIQLALEIANGSEKPFTPKLTVFAGETFAIEQGNKYLTGSGMIDETLNIKCATALQPENSLALDCNFRSTTGERDNTRTKSWQAKILVTNGKPAAMWFGDKPGSGADKQQGLGVNILADWAKVS